MVKRAAIIVFVLCGFFFCQEARACSVLYYVDPHTGKIYVANNEDYWYDVDEALVFLERKKIALDNAHMMFGDSTGHAVVLEWIDGQRKIVSLSNNYLIMTNFLLSDPSRGNHPCPRYQSIEDRVNQLDEADQALDLRSIGNAMAGAIQLPRALEDERVGGTLYSSFISISDMEFVLVYKLNNTKVTRLDLKDEFQGRGRKKLNLN